MAHGEKKKPTDSYRHDKIGTRGRGEVLGQAGVAEACAYTLEGVSKNQKKVKITTN